MGTKQTRSAFEVVESGQSGNLVTIMDLRDEEVLELEYIKMEYSGAGTVSNINVEVQDQLSGDTVGDTSEDTALDVAQLNPGEVRLLEDPTLEDVQYDLNVVVDRDATGVDGDILVTFGGKVVV